MEDKYSYNLILLGGTGARCGEIFVHMCANGYFEAKAVNILYIDSDTKNGNAEYFKRVVAYYNKCQKQYLIEESPIPCFFKTKINFMEVNPVQNIKKLRELASQSGTNPREVNSAEKLMEALYSEEECEMVVSEGFFAHPNVGAALFAANIDKIMDPFLKVINIAQKDMKKIKIFMIGSIFGGTGASSLPTISKYLKDKLFGGSQNKLIDEQLQIGACMVLPYFAFSREEAIEKLFSNNSNSVEIEADKFVTKTKAALQYYKYIDGDYSYKVFDRLYILGHDNGDVRGKYNTAGADQRNLPHIVELCASMSGVAFFESKIGEKGQYFMPISADKIGWGDFYKSTQGFFCFFIMMRFAIVMKSLIFEELFDYKKGNTLKEQVEAIPWYFDFLNGKDQSLDMDPDKLYSKFESISRYCTEYIRWFAELNINNIEKINIPDKIEFRKNRKRNHKNKESDLMEYLEIFSKEIVINQYMNNLISDGELSGDYSEKEKERIYQDNLKKIRKSFEELEMKFSYTDFKESRIKMKDIWTRLSDFGFNSSPLDEELFKNIRQSIDKGMNTCVRNLINAAYIACMI